MTGSAGSAVDVLGSAIAFLIGGGFGRRIVGGFAGSEGRRIYFMVLFRGSF